jgi:hypothetical protein
MPNVEAKKCGLGLLLALSLGLAMVMVAAATVLVVTLLRPGPVVPAPVQLGDRRPAEGTGRVLEGDRGVPGQAPADPVPVELAEDEERGADEEGHGVVLERAAVPVAHQEVDQALGPLRVLGDLRQGLLPRGGHPGGPQHVRVGGAVLDQLHGHIAAVVGLVGHRQVLQGIGAGTGPAYEPGGAPGAAGGRDRPVDRCRNGGGVAGRVGRGRRPAR